MSWIPSSKGTALVVLLALSIAAAGTAAGLSVTEQSAPSEAEAGQQVEATVVIEDPFVDTNNEWTLEGNTGLIDDTTTWTITISDQGQQVNQTVYEGQNFSQVLNSANQGDEIVIEVSGETPSPEGSYDYRQPQSFTLYDLNRVTGNSQTDIPNATQTVHHYTNESRNAREAIDAAAEAINESNAGSSAQSTLNSSISSYDNGNFGNAIGLAEDAQSEAESAEQSQETQQTVLYAAVAVVILLLVGGSIYYWRSQQDDYGKLQ